MIFLHPHRLVGLLVLWIALAPQTRAQDPFQYDFRELAPGVWVGVREDMMRIPVMGNTTFVVSDVGVVVFDGGGVPLMSERTIAKIREVTDLPVTHVVISHWHGDHHFGVYRFREEFPHVQFVAHEFTYAAMTGSPIKYIEKQPEVVPRLREGFAEALETGIRKDGEDLQEFGRRRFEEFLEDSELIHTEYNRLRLTLPTLTFDNALTIRSGAQVIQLLFLGVGNTAGDIVMWLEADGIVATGDLVVHPTPYGFNVPPRSWAATLTRLKGLEYRFLVPGHGEVLANTEYVDLLIECSLSIADQADALLAKGVISEDAQPQLDFSAFESRFTRGNPDWADHFQRWFSNPMRKAVFKDMTGEAMVDIE